CVLVDRPYPVVRTGTTEQRDIRFTPAFQVADVVLDDRVQLGAGRAVVVRCDPAQEPPAGRAHHRHGVVLLGGEVVEQQAAGDAGGGGALVHGDLVDRPGGQQLQADADQLPPAILGLQPGPLCASRHWTATSCHY